MRARVGHEYYPSFETMLDWPDRYSMKYLEHMMAWSRVDYLMNVVPDGFAAWFDAVKTPFAGAGPSAEQMRARQLAALKDAWDLEPATFDAAWSAWAEKFYPRK